MGLVVCVPERALHESPFPVTEQEAVLVVDQVMRVVAPERTTGGAIEMVPSETGVMQVADPAVQKLGVTQVVILVVEQSVLVWVMV